MGKPALLCMVSSKGTLIGPAIGLRRIAHTATGSYLLFARFPDSTDDARLSALPNGWAAQMSPHERGILVKILDRAGRPADHGFCVVVEKGTKPREAPPELVSARTETTEATSDASGFQWPSRPEA